MVPSVVVHRNPNTAPDADGIDATRRRVEEARTSYQTKQTQLQNAEAKLGEVLENRQKRRGGGSKRKFACRYARKYLTILIQNWRT